MVSNMMRKFFNTGSKLLILIGIFFIFNSFFVNPVYSASVDITQINFTSSPQTINTNTNSAVISVQTQNIGGTSEQISETNHLDLTTTSSTGEFFNANSSSCTSAISSPAQLTMSTGSANKNFCYRDSTPGTYTITVAAQGQSWTSATQDIVIVGDPVTLSSIAITTPATKTEYATGDALDITGLVVTGTYSDSSTNIETITESNITGFDSSVPIIGQVLTITVGAQVVTYTININTPAIPTETFIIRNGDTVLFDGSIPLPDAGTVDISGHTVNTQSVLAVLKSIDDANDSFEISNLQFFDSFNSFYLKCITPNGESELCDNWQYAVGSVTPFSSIDTTILAGGETIGIYFGNSHQVVLSSTAIATDQSLEAAAQKYNYTNNIWEPLTGVNIGVTLPNESDPWNPIIVSTSPVDSNGLANIIIATPNTYTVGIAEDYYFPSYSVVVTDPVPAGCNCSGSNTPVFSITNAINYLKNVQDSDGSFGGSMLYTDWAAIAYASNGWDSSVKTKILNYMQLNNSISGIVTDNERHAMALLTLGQNPYDFNGVNYIKSITDSFDGTQLGDLHLDNDDIFGLIVLLKVGYTMNDNEISKTIQFVLGAQQQNGSWDNSVDMTSAAIQALKQFESAPGVSDGIFKASAYLENTQSSDGGWGNVSSTSWAMQAGSVMGTQYIKNNKTGLDYLANAQFTDGGMLTTNESLQNRIWTTSYAVPAGLGKSWSQILPNVSKPIVPNLGGNDDKTKDDLKNKEEKKDIEVKKDIEKIEPEKIEEVKIETPIEVVVKEEAPLIKRTVAVNKKTTLVKKVEKETIPNIDQDLNKELLTASVIKSNWKLNMPKLHFFKKIKFAFSGFQSLFSK